MSISLVSFVLLCLLTNNVDAAASMEGAPQVAVPLMATLQGADFGAGEGEDWGRSVAIVDIGEESIAFVGAPGTDGGRGAVYMIKRAAGTAADWSLIEKFCGGGSCDSADISGFGYSIAATRSVEVAEGGYVVVGAPDSAVCYPPGAGGNCENAGRVHTYSFTKAGVTPLQTHYMPIDNYVAGALGTSISIANNARYYVAGAPRDSYCDKGVSLFPLTVPVQGCSNAGAIVVGIVTAAEVSLRATQTDAVKVAAMGTSVDIIRDDFFSVAVGLPLIDKAYKIRFTTNFLSNNYFQYTNGKPDTSFGKSVAFVGKSGVPLSQTLVIGASEEADAAGAVYIVDDLTKPYVHGVKPGSLGLAMAAVREQSREETAMLATAQSDSSVSQFYPIRVQAPVTFLNELEEEIAPGEGLGNAVAVSLTAHALVGHHAQESVLYWTPVGFVPDVATPTNAPSAKPTASPVTPSPTEAPSKSPSQSPTEPPTKLPTRTPTQLPTRSPSKMPTDGPTKAPSRAPTDVPTRLPTKPPTKSPTRQPSTGPSPAPTDAPTDNPTKLPTRMPTRAPTQMPTKFPSRAPSEVPTRAPTGAPTKNPTVVPGEPSPAPTTPFPTDTPTRRPTKAPTLLPTKSPTHVPSRAPSRAPTGKPTRYPTAGPTQSPTRLPTRAPSKAPTRAPTTTPTFLPSDLPTKVPTTTPTRAPSSAPTPGPTVTPGSPSRAPTKRPTNAPSTTPTRAPSSAPLAPSMAPTLVPTPVIQVEGTTAASPSVSSSTLESGVTTTNSAMSSTQNGGGTDTQEPSSTSAVVTVDRIEPTDSPGSSMGGTIAAIVIILLIVCCLLVVAAVVFRRRRQQKAAEGGGSGREMRAFSPRSARSRARSKRGSVNFGNNSSRHGSRRQSRKLTASPMLLSLPSAPKGNSGGSGHASKSISRKTSRNQGVGNAADYQRVPIFAPTTPALSPINEQQNGGENGDRTEYGNLSLTAELKRNGNYGVPNLNNGGAVNTSSYDSIKAPGYADIRQQSSGTLSTLPERTSFAVSNSGTQTSDNNVYAQLNVTNGATPSIANSSESEYHRLNQSDLAVPTYAQLSKVTSSNGAEGDYGELQLSAPSSAGGTAPMYDSTQPLSGTNGTDFVGMPTENGTSGTDFINMPPPKPSKQYAKGP